MQKNRADQEITITASSTNRSNERPQRSTIPTNQKRKIPTTIETRTVKRIIPTAFVAVVMLMSFASASALLASPSLSSSCSIGRMGAAFLSSRNSRSYSRLRLSLSSYTVTDSMTTRNGLTHHRHELFGTEFPVFCGGGCVNLLPRRRYGNTARSANSDHVDGEVRGTIADTIQTDDDKADNPPPDTSKRRRKKKKKDKNKSKDLRRDFIGMAKAVDRGQWDFVYSPGGDDGKQFTAKSGLPDMDKRPFVVLGIESSCDDTGAAIVRSDGTILGEALASQTTIHEAYGGVVPSLAKNAHELAIDTVVADALADAGLESVADVDGIGVTVGPGLEICLRVGCEKAKALAMEYGKVFVGVHHLEAHILMARFPFERDAGAGAGAGDGDGQEVESGSGRNAHGVKRAVEFPFLALLVSGGHCQLLKCLGIGRYEIIGGTIDDSLGEAYDKIARLLNLPIGGGGGPAIEALALEGDPNSVPLPIPLQNRRDCDFSYAGLKTAVRVATERIRTERHLDSVNDLDRKDRADIAASFQNVAIRHVEDRLKRAMDGLEEEEGFVGEGGVRSLVVVGGVAANKELRGRLERVCCEREMAEWRMIVPPPRLCTDQGSMSAWAAIERIEVGSSDVAEGQEVFARFPFKANTAGEVL